MQQATTKETRQRRRERAARATRRRVWRRRGLTIGVIVLVVVGGLLGGSWLLGSRDNGSGSSTAIYTFETQDFHSLAFDPEDADTIFFGHHGGLMVSGDGGSSWQDSTLDGVDAMQLALPAGGQRRYAAGHDVFYRSDDGGATWQAHATNLPGLDLHAFAGSLRNPDRLYAIPLGFGLYTSADGGSTWQEATLPPLPDTQPTPIAVVPGEPETILLAQAGQIATSRDAGTTWTSEPGPPGIITAITVAADERQTVYAGTVNGVYRRTVDGWTKLPIELDGATVAIAVSPTIPDRIALLDQNGQLYRSDDGGASWLGR